MALNYHHGKFLYRQFQYTRLGIFNALISLDNLKVSGIPHIISMDNKISKNFTHRFMNRCLIDSLNPSSLNGLGKSSVNFGLTLEKKIEKIIFPCPIISNSIIPSNIYCYFCLITIIHKYIRKFFSNHLTSPKHHKPGKGKSFYTSSTILSVSTKFFKK